MKKSLDPETVSLESSTPEPSPTPTEMTTEATEVWVSLNDFCRRLSTTDRRVALIGGFHLTMRIAQREQDTETAYRAAFHQFAQA